MTEAHVTKAGEARSIAWIGGTVHRIPIGATESDGRQTILRTHFQQGTASPVHVHDRDDETFCVLSGTMTIWAGRERWQLSAGDTAFLPRGLPHAYRIDSSQADVLTVCNPGGTEELFFAAGWDLKEPVPEGWSVDMALLGPLGERSGQHVLAPTLEGDALIPDEVLAKA